MNFYVEYSEEDKEYVGLCEEYPGLSYLDKTKEFALEGIIHLTLIVIQDLIVGWTEDLLDDIDKGLTLMLNGRAESIKKLNELHMQLDYCYKKLPDDV